MTDNEGGMKAIRDRHKIQRGGSWSRNAHFICMPIQTNVCYLHCRSAILVDKCGDGVAVACPAASNDCETSSKCHRLCKGPEIGLHLASRSCCATTCSIDLETLVIIFHLMLSTLTG